MAEGTVQHKQTQRDTGRHRETHRSTDGATVVLVQRLEEAACLSLELIPEERPMCRQLFFQGLEDRVGLALELLTVRELVRNCLIETEKTQRGNTLKEREAESERERDRETERKRDRERALT